MRLSTRELQALRSIIGNTDVSLHITAYLHRKGFIAP